MGKEKPPPKNQGDFMRYAGMGTQMAAIIGLGVFAGVKLDKWVPLKYPVFTLVLSLLSVFLAIYFFIKDQIKKK